MPEVLLHLLCPEYVANQYCQAIKRRIHMLTPLEELEFPGMSAMTLTTESSLHMLRSPFLQPAQLPRTITSYLAYLR